MLGEALNIHKLVILLQWWHYMYYQRILIGHSSDFIRQDIISFVRVLYTLKSGGITAPGISTASTDAGGFP